MRVLAGALLAVATLLSTGAARAFCRTTTVAMVEPALAEVAPGEVVQFERLGYFAADLDDPSVFHRTVGLRDEWANIQKQRTA